jgi:hypothetical protein
MVDISDMLVSDSPYSKAKDFEDFAEKCTIDEVGTDSYQDNPPFIWLKLSGLEKPAKTNKTTARGLAANFGSELDDWVGKSVMVVSIPSQMPDGTPTRSFSISKAGKVKGKPAPVNAAPDDDIPF